MRCRSGNSKFEARNPKQIQSTKSQARTKHQAPRFKQETDFGFPVLNSRPLRVAVGELRFIGWDLFVIWSFAYGLPAVGVWSI
jgi:hypothetical protein